MSSGNHRAIERAAAAIRKALGTDGDVLDEITARLDMPEEETAISTTAGEVPLEPVEDETDPAEAARRAVAQWRRSVVRSAEGRTFAKRVRDAYSDTCAISGDGLPKLPSTASAGVDGAHILPWARYELNTLKNGICLNKLCHWGFDAGVIRLDYDGSDYVVSIPDVVQTEGPPRGMTLDYFERLTGPIPTERFPVDPANRPSPSYLEHLNAEMYGAT